MKEPILYKILRPIITFLFKLIYRPTIIGKDNILQNEKIILAGNHTNYLDCLLLIASTKRTIHFVAKKELSKGLFSIIFKNMGLIFVNRKEKNKDSIKEAENYLKNNKVLGIFPEGTINRTIEPILPFKYGVVKIAKDTNSYIVPFVIKGKYKILKRNITITFYKAYKIKSDLTKEKENLERIIIKGIK